MEQEVQKEGIEVNKQEKIKDWTLENEEKLQKLQKLFKEQEEFKLMDKINNYKLMINKREEFFYGLKK